jgi:hypothetical protein
MTDSVYLAATYRLHATVFRMSAEALAGSLRLNARGQAAGIQGLPFYFLVSHATELLLKSALLKRGFTEADVKRSEYRHSLSSMLAELEKLGLVVTPETKATVNGLHEQHASHALRYTALIDNGELTYSPPVSAAYTMLDELLMLTRISTQGR